MIRASVVRTAAALVCASGLVARADVTVDQADSGKQCSAEASAHADKGKRLALVLAMDEARQAFQRAATLDPQCPVVQWGLAVSNLPWPGATPTRLAEARARDELTRAGEAATGLQRAHVQALTSLFEPADEPFPRRRLAYRDALRRLVKAHPGDNEAVVWLAFAELALSTVPGDEAAKRAAAVVGERFGGVPRVASAAFALLLAIDDGASPGDDAHRVADVVARTAPAVPGPRHASARLYRELGLWEEAARQDEVALGLVDALIDRRLMYGPGQQSFMPESLLSSYTELGRFEDAAALVERIEEALARPDEAPEPATVDRARRGLAEMRVRLALERQDLTLGASLPRRLFADQDLDLYWFARGMSAARSAFPHQDQAAFAEAREAAAELEVLARAAGASSESMRRWLLVRAAIAGGQYERDEMTVMLRQAQEIEGNLRASGQLRQPLLWAEEVAGDLRLQVDETGHARLHYVNLLAKQPRRARALLGLARAERLRDQPAAAGAAYRRFLEVWGQADAGRPELDEARTFLAEGAFGERALP
ncbi:MAG: hypothetical protein GEV06_06305 [Luteitalea sp.]|nr:hypothetical protein [Luteitalea sp.]